jgi:hypothetical protein
MIGRIPRESIREQVISEGRYREQEKTRTDNKEQERGQGILTEIKKVQERLAESKRDGARKDKIERERERERK